MSQHIPKYITSVKITLNQFFLVISWKMNDENFPFLNMKKLILDFLQPKFTEKEQRIFRD
jgi:hypothetical protein